MQKRALRQGRSWGVGGHRQRAEAWDLSKQCHMTHPDCPWHVLTIACKCDSQGISMMPGKTAYHESIARADFDIQRILAGNCLAHLSSFNPTDNND